MSKNVCRPIIFYNDFVPPYEGVQDWDYYALGYYDGISVGANLFLNMKADYSNLWYYSVDYAAQLKGISSSQIVYAFREEDGNEYVTDQEFWDGEEPSNAFFCSQKERRGRRHEERLKKEKLPLMFISMLHLNEPLNDLKGQKQLLERRINELATENGKALKAILYLTLDSSDLLLITKCRKYEEGASLVHAFHEKGNDINLLGTQRLTLSYSYTVFSINRLYLEKSEQEENEFSRTGIRSVRIHLIEKKPGSAGELKGRIEEFVGKNHVRYDFIQGCDDVVLTLDDISWRQFFRLYNTSGTCNYLSNNNAFFRRCIVGITAFLSFSDEPAKNGMFRGNAIWNFSITGTGDEAEKEAAVSALDVETTAPAPEEYEKERRDVFFESLLNIHKDTFNHLLDEMKKEMEAGEVNTQNEKKLMYYKVIWLVLNSLLKFNRSNLKDYTYFSLYKPMEMFLTLIKQIEGQGTIGEKMDLQTGIYDFLTSMNLIAQNSLKADRQFTQSIDLNVKIYDVPVKLSAFYSAFVYYVRDYLNLSRSEGKRYEFVVCPGMTDEMNVKMIFPGATDSKRLMIAQVPERQMFNVKLLLIMLGHEIAHFVGSKSRSRKYRCQAMVEVISRSIALFAWFDPELGAIMTDEHLIDVGNRLMNCVQGRLDRAERGENESKQYHMQYLHNDLEMAFIDVLQKDRESVFKSTLFNGMNIWIKGECIEQGGDIMKRVENRKEHKEKLHKQINNFCNGLMRGEMYRKKTVNITNLIDLIVYLFKECYADIISIETLRISQEDYVRAFMQNRGECPEKIYLDSQLTMRMAIVHSCMFDGVNDPQMFCWERNKLEEMAGGEDNMTAEFCKMVLAYVTECIETGEPIARQFRRDKGEINKEAALCDIGYYKKINHVLMDYLLQARGVLRKNGEREKREIIRNIYNKVQQIEKSEESVYYITQVIDEYRCKILSELT